MRKIVLDIDGTISFTSNGDYENAQVIQSTKAKLLAYQQQGFEIILYTSRNMRTYENNTGKINAKTTPVLIAWLEKNGIPFDELHIGKPWCGDQGFYVDDRAIRPDEFASLNPLEIEDLLNAAANKLKRSEGI
jgi:capsule biosynthesis phosphatase